ncbi:hypothetical protein SHELI_v1c05780 [Spiroplasma helicoides]|uniref:Metallo-beta-lactamase domain-containing protein n=1 Tax=Spiroplasma helicoides TaxID=216938 RepID=A0A1B3SKR5_9MOLU|nr:MBL fold metallo-hydrolase [Spiroplasma helicoides]AOG60529.1 hypothetical protein SHELI_v1c05780 [Spiroplasma helicoides]
MIKIFSDINFKEVNAYLIYNDKNQAILIDTANKAHKEIIEFVKNQNLILTDIFITHGHFPHFYGLNEICNQLNHPNVYIGKEDMTSLFDSKKT